MTYNKRDVIDLFPYQKHSIDVIKKAFFTKSRALLSIAVGYGRSVIIVQALKDLLDSYKVKSVLIVSPRIILLEQFCRVLTQNSVENLRIISKNDIPLLDNNLKPQILLSTINFLTKYESRIPKDFFELVILDECHQFTDKDWVILEKFQAPIVGFTTIPPSLFNSKMLDFFKVKSPNVTYGMAVIRLKELANVFKGVAYRSNDLLEKGNWKFLRPRDVNKNQIINSSAFASDYLIQKNRDKILRVGDILLQNIFQFNKMAIVQNKDLPAIASNNFFIIRPKKVDSQFLIDYLQSSTILEVIQKQLDSVAYGEIIKHIRIKDLEEVLVPLPFSDEIKLSYKNLKENNIKDLIRINNEIKELKNAYQKNTLFGEQNDKG